MYYMCLYCVQTSLPKAAVAAVAAVYNILYFVCLYTEIIMNRKYCTTFVHQLPIATWKRKTNSQCYLNVSILKYGIDFPSSLFIIENLIIQPP